MKCHLKLHIDITSPNAVRATFVATSPPDCEMRVTRLRTGESRGAVAAVVVDEVNTGAVIETRCADQPRLIVHHR